MKLKCKEDDEVVINEPKNNDLPLTPAQEELTLFSNKFDRQLQPYKSSHITGLKRPAPAASFKKKKSS